MNALGNATQPAYRGFQAAVACSGLSRPRAAHNDASAVMRSQSE